MKKIRKMLPVSIYDLCGLETWLEEQAKAGLFPVFMNSWVTFTPTALPGTRFRLEPREGDGDSPGPEMLEKCREAGWDFALTVGSLYYLFYTTRPGVSELCFDDRGRMEYMARIERRSRRSRLTGWAVFLLTAALGLWGVLHFQSSFDVQPDHYAGLPLILLSLFEPTMLIMAAALLLIYRQSRQDRRAMRKSSRVSEKLRRKVSPSRWAAVGNILVMALAVLVLIGGLCRTLELNPFDHIALEKFGRPYVDIQELESREVTPWEELFQEAPPGGQPENYGRLRFSLLSPCWYSVTQEAYGTEGTESRIFSPLPEEGQAYAPDLDMTCFTLLIPAMARPVALAQLDEYRLVNLRWSYEELDVPGLDFAILAEEPEGIWQMAALGRGGRVAVFRYAGEEKLEEHMELLASMVA